MRRPAWIIAAIMIAAMVGARVDARQSGDARTRLYVPNVSRGAVAYRDVPTAMLTSTPTATLTPSVTSTPTATGTPDVVGTIVAATLTAGAPTPSDTPTPSVTPDRVQTSVAATLTALAPTVTRTPTATRTATATSTPAPVCVEQIKNGGFEDDMDYWNASGDRVESIVGRPSDAPFEGSRFAEVWPRNDGTFARIESAGFKPPPGSTVVSAMVRYQIRGRSLERLDRLDSIIVILNDPNALRCVDCRRTLEVLYNEDVPRDWRSRVFDITEQARADWPEMAIEFAAKNDLSDSTWWHVDAVSLTICTR